MTGGLGTAEVIAGLAAITVLAMVLLAADLAAQRSNLPKRIRSAAAVRRQQRPAPAGMRGGAGRHEAMGLLRVIVQRLRLLRSRQMDGVRLKLACAGWRSNDALTLYLFGKLALPFVFGGAATLVFHGFEAWGLSGAHRALLIVAAALIGSYFPDVIVKNAKQRRQDALRMAVPDALDLMVICAEAGLSLDPAITRIAREIEASCPEMADELQLTASELRFLPERRRAWENLARRTDLASLRALVNALIQTERYGTSLTQSVRVLAEEQRAERMLRAEEKAARLPAIMTVPLILFILPALFIILLGPAVIDIIETLGRL